MRGPPALPKRKKVGKKVVPETCHHTFPARPKCPKLLLSISSDDVSTTWMGSSFFHFRAYLQAIRSWSQKTFKRGNPLRLLPCITSNGDLDCVAYWVRTPKRFARLPPSEIRRICHCVAFYCYCLILTCFYADMFARNLPESETEGRKFPSSSSIKYPISSSQTRMTTTAWLLTALRSFPAECWGKCSSLQLKRFPVAVGTALRYKDLWLLRTNI